MKTKLKLFYLVKLVIVFVLYSASNCECQNGATCVHDATLPGGTMCVCVAGYTGILCETCKLDNLN